MKISKALRTALAVITDYIPAFVLGIATLIVVVDVIGRYGFHHPFIGVSELALLGMQIIVFLGAIGVMQRGDHIALELFVDRLGERGRAIADTVVGLVIAGTLGALLYLGIKFVTTTAFSNLLVTGLSRRVVALAIPIMAGLMLIVVVQRLVVSITGIVTGEYQRIHHDDPDEAPAVVEGTI